MYERVYKIYFLFFHVYDLYISFFFFYNVGMNREGIYFI